jgi:hypothetical protein
MLIDIPSNVLYSGALKGLDIMIIKRGGHGICVYHTLRKVSLVYVIEYVWGVKVYLEPP